MKTIRYAIATAACVAALDAAASCGSAFCLVNTDWSAQGAWTEPGFRADLRYESIDLDQPMHGTERVAVGEIPRHHDEVETRNRNLVATLGWGFAPGWDATFAVPYVDREHFHIHNHRGEQVPEHWKFRDLGDARVMLRRSLAASLDNPESIHTAGVTFGVKLPTGKFDVANEDGEAAERTLQPGTGTTDLVAGAYWYGGAPLRSLSWFAQAAAQAALDERDGYKPGPQLHLDAGVRYEASRALSLALQVNYLAKGRDSGVNAEPDDSGQRQVFVSPGLAWNFARGAQAYAFVQLPVYRAVNGVQLVADRSYAAGVSFAF